ncbi:hypothetical protein SCHPADRAFT_938415 [Schizopora paradoxa]|uniref:Uncharacterized protein n=1 Tax=Schizopora paradoxa TaxID=27342 RepID=A0A0H2RW30_9AGAM|nr:hypothetical protein SCHPADRAFT_938415 [Schizopora paradoxa]
MAQVQDTFSNFYELEFINTEEDFGVQFYLHDRDRSPTRIFSAKTSVGFTGFTTYFSTVHAAGPAANITWYPDGSAQAHGELKMGQNLVQFTKEQIVPLVGGIPGSASEQRSFELFGTFYRIGQENNGRYWQHGVWFHRNGIQWIKCAIIHKEGYNKLRIRLSDNAATLGLPFDVMANLRIPGRPLKLFLAAICLQTPLPPFTF